VTAPGAPTRLHDDEAVRRLREESRLRVEQQRRWRAFAGWCAVATLAGGISLAALDANDARVLRDAEVVQAEPPRQEPVAALSVTPPAAPAPAIEVSSPKTSGR
jgi:hypothetical protein